MAGPINLNQKITLWKVISENGSGGYIFSAPLTVPAKWVFKAEKFVDINGETRVSKAVFYTEELFEVNFHKVYFGESTELEPPEDAEDIKGIVQNPSMFGELRKGWV